MHYYGAFAADFVPSCHSEWAATARVAAGRGSTTGTGKTLNSSGAKPSQPPTTATSEKVGTIFSQRSSPFAVSGCLPGVLTLLRSSAVDPRWAAIVPDPQQRRPHHQDRPLVQPARLRACERQSQPGPAAQVRWAVSHTAWTCFQCRFCLRGAGGVSDLREFVSSAVLICYPHAGSDLWGRWMPDIFCVLEKKITLIFLQTGEGAVPATRGFSC